MLAAAGLRDRGSRRRLLVHAACGIATSETWYLPWPVGRAATSRRSDENRTVQHALGFVPMVWVRNLPGGDGTDGACTFRAAIETAIEIDYQL